MVTKGSDILIVVLRVTCRTLAYSLLVQPPQEQEHSLPESHADKRINPLMVQEIYSIGCERVVSMYLPRQSVAYSCIVKLGVLRELCTDTLG
jgi:hypothetical protein